ncbi:MAG: hydroxysqualene dehydroxylase HpnE [Gallionellaceae bacterium]|nr:hydroxysqualene dehydroxylase HpnE [Gallionellaceae bacterium]
MAGIQDLVEKLNSIHPARVAIIGGGYAGMAAAVALSARGIPVTIYESAKQLGGRARGLERNGARLDNGQHILLGCYHDTLQLIEQVGGNIGQDFLRLPLQLTLHNRFEFKAANFPAPFHLLSGLMTASGLSLRQRLSASRFMLTLRRMRFAITQDITALDFLRARQQDQDLIRLLWEPICVAALNTPIDKASARVLLNVLRDSLNGARADSDMLLSRLDFSALFPNRAADYVERNGGSVRLACGVDAIVPRETGIELHTAHGAEHFTYAICAASPSSAAQLLEKTETLTPIAAQIRALEFQPIYTVYLQYPDDVSLPHPMLGLDRGCSQWLFDKGQIDGQYGLIAAVISAEGAHQQLEQTALAQRVAQELREQFDIVATPLWHQVIAEKRATFCCQPNLDRPSQITPVDRLLLAGDYTSGDYPATLEGAVMSGLRCAAAIQD